MIKRSLQVDTFQNDAEVVLLFGKREFQYFISPIYDRHWGLDHQQFFLRVVLLPCSIKSVVLDFMPISSGMYTPTHPYTHTRARACTHTHTHRHTHTHTQRHTRTRTRTHIPALVEHFYRKFIYKMEKVNFNTRSIIFQYHRKEPTCYS